MNEQIWRAAESNMARRERVRLIRLGRIIPAHRMQAELMVKDTADKWWPNSNFVQGEVN